MSLPLDLPTCAGACPSSCSSCRKLPCLDSRSTCYRVREQERGDHGRAHHGHGRRPGPCARSWASSPGWPKRSASGTRGQLGDLAERADAEPLEDLRQRLQLGTGAQQRDRQRSEEVRVVDSPRPRPCASACPPAGPHLEGSRVGGEAAGRGAEASAPGPSARASLPPVPRRGLSPVQARGGRRDSKKAAPAWS